ncbi:MAG: PqqD family protein [Pyrinomonadaceae bacterium]|nr:PqqD family protein [Pyrinomonadaceae bacterium]
MKSMPPMARTEKLVVQDSVNEVLVYDLETNTAHCLNETAAFVWSNCDGKKSVTEIEILVTKKFGSDAGQDFVWLALDSLKKSNLLKNSDTIETNFDGLSRRQVIKQIGFASMIALPLVSSIVAPSAVAALSDDLAVCGGACIGMQCPSTCSTCTNVGTCSNTGNNCTSSIDCLATGTCIGVTGMCSPNIFTGAPGPSCTSPLNCPIGTCNGGGVSCSVPGGTCSFAGLPCSSSGTCSSAGSFTCV